MKTYPSIPGMKDLYKFKGQTVYCFDKLDGSNIRAEWNKKKGFYKFGSRTRLLDANEKPLGESVSLIQDKYSSELAKIFKDQKTERAICFFEFWGENSAFGQHKEESHDVSLIDVSFFKKGILLPEEFLDLFGGVDHAKLLYKGQLTSELIDSIKDGTLEGMHSEGVVCKSSRVDKKKNIPIMIKIKRKDWYDRLETYCNGNRDLYRRLV